MTYTAGLDSVYNHYLTSYTPKTSQYDTHKKSELRRIYNSIVKLNKEYPIYILDTSNESRQFVVELKEGARTLHNTIASLGGLDEDEMLGKKTAFSSNENIASATYIGGEDTEDNSVPAYDIEVSSLASNQVNVGTFLPSNGKAELEPDAYSFDVSVNGLSYEFQYNIREGETNRKLQERLARLISNADIGITADLLEDGKGASSLRLISASSGLNVNKDFIFQVSDDKTSKRSGTIDYLGISYVYRPPSNAEFLLNGEPRSTSSNHFTIDKNFEISLNGVSSGPGDVAQIGLKTDLDSLTENVGNLTDGYNSFLDSASEYLESHPRSGKLLNEMEHICRHYQEGLEELGFSIEEKSHLKMDEDTFRNSISADDGRMRFSTIKDFTNSVLRKVDQISLDPMEYVDKKLVAYKNPVGHNLPAPYMTCTYSGMLFSGFC